MSDWEKEEYKGMNKMEQKTLIRRENKNADEEMIKRRQEKEDERRLHGR